MIEIKEGPSEKELVAAVAERKPVNFTFGLKGEMPVYVDSFKPLPAYVNGEWWEINIHFSDVGGTHIRWAAGEYATTSENGYLGDVNVVCSILASPKRFLALRAKDGFCLLSAAPETEDYVEIQLTEGQQRTLGDALDYDVLVTIFRECAMAGARLWQRTIRP